MSKVITIQKNGIPIRYVDADNRYDGRHIRIYLLPGVPTNAGALVPRYDVDESKMSEILALFKEDHRKKVSELIKLYDGRSADAFVLLDEAEKLDRFDEIAKKLTDYYDSDLKYMHPDMRMSRTDVNAFLIQLYADVGLAPQKDADNAKGLVERYGGAGLMVLLREDQLNEVI
ncbi:MAG: hypothetical protein ABR981_03240 [Candidatus Micrarchaeaceae archaeon]|jgi:hypothetical protein